MSLPIFFCALLSDPELREAVLRLSASALPALPATLDAHRLTTEAAQRPGLLHQPGSALSGVAIAGLGRRALSRLRRYAGLTGLERREVTLRIGDRPSLAVAFLPAAARDPAAPAWSPNPLLRQSLILEAQELLDTGLDAGWSGAGSHGALATRTAPIRALAQARAQSERRPVSIQQGLTRDATETAATKRAHRGYFALDILTLRHRRFDGRMSRTLQREVFLSGDAVSVLPWDPHRDLVLLVEQWRAGPHARGDRMPWMLEVVAGRCDANETPEATARREAREEAGVTLGRMARIAGYYSSPGIASEHMTSFVGEADLGQAGGVYGLPGEDEDIRAVAIPFAQALQGVADGEVANAPAILSLLWLVTQKARLKAAWTGPA
ncbi:MAG: NUDIX domain-containing protein [Pseudomonadota bacterium]